MEEYLRIFHHDNIRILHSFLLVCLKEREHVDASHSFPHTSRRALLLIPGLPHTYSHGERPLDIQVHGIYDLIAAAVFAEVFIDFPGKCIQIQIVQLIFQKLCRFKRVQFFCRLLTDQSDTGKTAVAFFRHVKHTTAGTHLLKQVILLHQQQIILELLHISLRIHKINVRKYLRNILVILLMAVAVPDAAFAISDKLKAQRSLSCRLRRSFRFHGSWHITTIRRCFCIGFIRRQFPAEIPVPCLISAVSTDQTEPVEPSQIICRDLKLHPDLHIRKILPEILFFYNIVSAHCPHGVKDSSLSGVILSDQYKGIFNTIDMHIFNRFKITYPKIRYLHTDASCLQPLHIIRAELISICRLIPSIMNKWNPTYALFSEYFIHLLTLSELVNKLVKITNVLHQRFFYIFHPHTTDHSFDQFSVLIEVRSIPEKITVGAACLRKILQIVLTVPGQPADDLIHLGFCPAFSDCFIDK